MKIVDFKPAFGLAGSETQKCIRPSSSPVEPNIGDYPVAHEYILESSNESLVGQREPSTVGNVIPWEPNTVCPD